MSDFTNKIVVITGAAGSLGQAVTTAFQQAGASLALVDHRMERLKEVHGELAASTGALLVAADLTDESLVQAMANKVIDHFGRVDVLTNIAGGFTMGSRVHETSLKDWDFMLNLNAKSVFLTCRAILPAMLKQGQGKIVNIAARAATEGKAKMAPYCLSKAAAIRLTESMAAEYRNDNINVNCILPGTIDTLQNRADMPDADFSKWVPTSELADAILYLASEQAHAVHGAALPVYGMS